MSAPYETALIEGWYNASPPRNDFYDTNQSSPLPLFLNTVIDGKYIIVPKLIPKRKVDTKNSVYLPLIVDSAYPYKYKTKPAILRHITRSVYDYYITEVKFDNTTFYYSKGLITDASFRPLCLAASKYAITEYHQLTDRVYMLYISPRVFTENTNLSKLIRNSIFPTFVENIQGGEVVIKDFDEFFITPKYQEDLGKALYTDVLVNKIAEIKKVLTNASDTPIIF